MENIKPARKYGRSSRLSLKSTETKLLSDLFDKITGSKADKNVSSESHRMEGQQYYRRSASHDWKKKTKAIKTAAGATLTEKKTKKKSETDSEPAIDKSTSAKTSYRLFESHIEAEKTPMKAKQGTPRAVHRPTKESRILSRKQSVQANLQKAVEHSIATPTSMAGSISPKYPSLETFRDLQKRSFDKSLCHKEGHPSYIKSSVSMSDSFPDMVTTSSNMDQAEPVFCQPRQWVSAGVRQQSFVKIRTPCPHSDCSQAELASHDRDHESADVEHSSYTSVYTWTTATDTLIHPPHTGAQMDHEKLHSNSPSLVLRTYQQDNLQSTPFLPHQGLRQDQSTPQVSPIKPLPDVEMRHSTPCAPTFSASPCGPHKNHSFISMPPRSVPPKCSTMLFCSPVAGAGDSPLDVSSINAALSDAMDQSWQAGKEVEHLHSSNWNLSSVQLQSEEEELLPLQKSELTVNSQEIIPASFSDASITLPTNKDLESDGDKHEAAVAGIDNKLSNQESGMATMPGTPSQSEQHHGDYSNSDFLQTDREGVTPAMILHSTPYQQHQHTRRFQKQSAVYFGEEIPNAISVDQGSVVGSRGNGSEQCSEIRNDDQEVKANSQLDRNPQKMGGSAVIQESLEGQYMSRRSRNHKTSLDNSMPSRNQRSAQHSKVQPQSPSKEDVEVCPVSSTCKKKTTSVLCSGHRPSLMMWVEPADSGFLDMVNNSPPDIIGLISRKGKGLTASP